MQGQETKVNHKYWLGLEITKDTETRMYPDVHFLGWKLVTIREVDVTIKAHQRHEGSPYSPFEATPRMHFSTTSGRPWGGLQTFTNFLGGKSQVDSLPEHSYRLGVSNLQD